MAPTGQAGCDMIDNRWNSQV